MNSQRLGSHDFSGIANCVFEKSKSVIPPVFTSPEVLSSAPDIAKPITEIFF